MRQAERNLDCVVFWQSDGLVVGFLTHTGMHHDLIQKQHMSTIFGLEPDNFASQLR